MYAPKTVELCLKALYPETLGAEAVASGASLGITAGKRGPINRGNVFKWNVGFGQVSF